MQKKAVIFFAHKKEAGFFLFHSKIKFEKINRNEFAGKYNNFLLKVFFTGVGEKSLEFLKYFSFEEFDYFIKAGTCAVIDADLPLLKAFIPEYVFNKDLGIKIQFGKNADCFLTGKNLLTLFKPLLDADEALRLSVDFSFIDMETFCFAEQFSGKNFIPLLVGTDRGTKIALFDFFKNLKKAETVLKDKLIYLLDII